MKILVKNIIQLAIIIIFLTYLSYSKDSVVVIFNESFAIHPKIGLGMNFYNSSFRNFQGSYDCGLFSGGSGFAWSLGLYTEKEIINNNFIGLGIGYYDRSGNLTLQNTLPARGMLSNDLTEFKSENKLSMNLSFIELNPEYRITIINQLWKGPLRLSCGLRFGMALNHSFEQNEYILEPVGAVFLNSNKTERLIASGDISTINSLQYGISAGIENQLKTGKNISISQQLTFDYNFNNVSSDVNWSLYSIRLDFGVRFSLMEEIDSIIHIDEPVIDTIITKKPVKPQLSLKFMKDSSDLFINTGNELLATLPIVNAIFFETDSSEIPEIYIKKDTLLPSLFSGDAVDNRKFILPRIAEIVKKNPEAHISIAGATSGNENESGGLELASKRAENIKAALIELGVNENVISLSSNILPKAQSNQDYKEGIFENQRADIFIKNAALQEYVGIQKFYEVDGKISLNIQYQNIPDSNNIKLETSFNDSNIKDISNRIYRMPIKMRIGNDTNQIKLKAVISYNELIIQDSTFINVEELPIMKKDIVFDNFKAILMFEYGNANLSSENQELLNQLINNLPENANIIINGSADALGTEQKNRQLAQLRAQNTKDYIDTITGSHFNIILDKNFKKFPEETPEGRFFNRSISIEIK